MMADLIDRQALIEDFRHCGASEETIEAIVYRINLHPAVDAVVLPCKVGDTVYYLFQYSDKRLLPFVRTAKVRKIYCANRKMQFLFDCVLKEVKEEGVIKTFYEKDFGKTVFLTREEAEAAINGKRRGDDG